MLVIRKLRLQFYPPTKESLLIRQSIFSFILFIATTTTSAIGQQELNNGPVKESKESTVIELRDYAYKHRLDEAKTTTTTVVVKKANYENDENSCPQFEELFKQYGLKPAKTFSYIAWRESRCRPNAVNAKWDDKGNVTWTLNKNGSIDRGLLQINSSWKTVVSKICKSNFNDMDVLYDLDCNLRVAKYLFDNGGLGHWGM